MEDLFWQAAGPLIADDEPSAVTLAGMAVLAADGMLVSLADTPANRAMFGSTGTSDDSAPFPQLRVVALTARPGVRCWEPSWAAAAPRARQRTLNVPGRQRHSQRTQKARPKFPTPPRPSPPSQGNRRSPYSRQDPPGPAAGTPASGRRNRPRTRAAAYGTARQPRRDTRAKTMARRQTETDSRAPRP
jgi:hypothetical protein